MDEPLIPMDVKGLMMDPMSSVPIVILRHESSAKFLPIWIGVFEANAIALQMEGVELPRPMTHDLATRLIEALGAELVKIVVCGLEEGTFFAEIVLRGAGGEVKVDARPSDAIALALRTGSEILVAESVLEKAKGDERTERLSKEEKVKKWLEDLDPGDLGKYTM
ncbi:MAG: bifunctional nuclease family protein [Acidobacteriota bacterium]